MSAEEPLSSANLADALRRAPVASLLVDLDGLVKAANDPAARLVDLERATDLLGTDIYRFTPEDPARHRLQDLENGTVEAAFGRIDLTTARNEHRTVTAWWRRLDTDDGVVALVVMTELEPISTPGTPTSSPGWMALITCDHDWRVVDVSADTQHLVGRADLVGHGLLGLIHPLDAGECITALALLEEAVRAVTVSVRVRAHDDWLPLHITFARLCPHQPPRLVCLLAPTPAGSGADRQLGALLEQRETGQLLAQLGPALTRLATTHALSAQDVEIIARSVRGESPRRIAREMYLSEGTVRNLLSALYRKFSAHSQLELVSAVLLGD